MLPVRARARRAGERGSHRLEENPQGKGSERADYSWQWTWVERKPLSNRNRAF